MNTRYFTPLLVILLMAFSFDAYSQPPRGRKPGQRQQKKERVKQLIYNEMEEKMKAEKKKKNTATNDIKNGFDTLSDAEIESKMKEALDARIEEAEVQKEYLVKIGDVIGFKKAAKVLSLEAQFKRELVKRLSNDTNDNSSE